MEKMIQKLKKMVLDQIQNVEKINAECKRINEETFSVERCIALMEANEKGWQEYDKLRNMRHALASLRKAAGHKGINEFQPELF